jgi:hypothetical protein
MEYPLPHGSVMLEFDLEIEHEFLFEQVDSIILNEFLK